MDISDWTDEQIMQLPDHVLGEKYVVGKMEDINPGISKFFVTPFSLPAKIIIWQLTIYLMTDIGKNAIIGLRLSNTAAVNTTEFYAQDPIFPDIYDKAERQSQYRLTVITSSPAFDLKYLLSTGSRKVSCFFSNYNTVEIYMGFSMVISEVPTRVHGWLNSDEAKDRW